MLNKYLISIFTLILLFIIMPFVNAQNAAVEENKVQMCIRQLSIAESMDKIAADSSLRMQMLSKIIEQTKGNSDEMMQMCRMIMNDPEMHAMMSEMMNNEEIKGGNQYNQNGDNDSKKGKEKIEPESQNDELQLKMYF